MRRLLLSALLALGLHGLLLAMNPEWIPRRTAPLTRPGPLTIALTYRVPDVKTPAPPKRPVESRGPAVEREEKPVPVIEPPVHEKMEALRPPESPPAKKPSVPEMRKPSQKKKKRRPPKPARPQPDLTHPVVRERPREPVPLVVPADPGPSGREKSGAPAPLPPGEEIRGPVLPAEAEETPPAEVSPPLVEAVPEYRKNPPPRYPRIARRRGYEGTVILDVLVGPEGGVKEVRLFQSSGYSVLDRAAESSVRRWLFQPARRGDEAVAMWVKVPVRFQIK